MFSAFKKLASKPDLQNGSGSPQSSGVQSMSHNLQKKFSKGCNYNMKIVIRGDRNTGKSCLLQRLQGGPFIEDYKPTEEIQVASINWSYKNTEDVVKVEVWDVVDVAKKRKKLVGLKLGEAADGDEALEPGLDAQFLDVYKQAHGAIFCFDVTKPWTFEYVKNELARVPHIIPILILANFYDLAHHAQVTRLQIADFIENFSRQSADAAEVRWGEVSLRNGFGLKFLHKFFNVPFLTLQRQSLLQQLELNRLELEATQEELDLFMESEDASYERFSDSLAAKRRQAAEQSAPPPGKSIVAGQPSHVVDKPSAFNTSNSSGLLTFSNRATEAAAVAPAVVPGPPPKGSSPNTGSLAASRLSPSNLPTASKEASPARPPGSVRLDVDSFVPDVGDFDTFLEEEQSAASQLQNGIIDSSDDESSGINPMVSKFAEEIDSDTEYDTTAVDPAINGDDDDGNNVSVAKSSGKGWVPRSQPVGGFDSLFMSSRGKEAAGNDLEDFLGEPGPESGDSTACNHDGYDTL